MHKRRIRIGVAAALAVAVWCLPAAAVRQDIPGPILARVIEVIDGDTILVEARIWLDQVVTTRVRLAGVEPHAAYAGLAGRLGGCKVVDDLDRIDDRQSPPLGFAAAAHRVAVGSP